MSKKSENKITDKFGGRLNGWQRIGVVLSVLWFLLQLYHVLVYYLEFSSLSLPGIFGALVITGIGGILLGWIIGYIALWTFRWVKRGFDPG